MSCAPVVSRRIAAPLMLATLMVACKPAASQDTGPAAAAPVAQPQAMATATDTLPAELAALPQAPSTSPQPWVPYAVEKEMGAQWCPENPNDSQVPSDRARSTGLLHKPCLGLLPQHLAQVLLAIPDKDIFIPGAARVALVREPQAYLALPGRGTRPDFLTTVDFLEGITVRSFEGSSAADTVYLVQGPFRCIDNVADAAPEGAYQLDAAGCKAALADTRVYKWSSNGTLGDVTPHYLPAPQLTPAEQAAVEPGSLQLDLSHLSEMPTLRWTALLKSRNPGGGHDDYEPIAMPADIPAERRLGDALHFGFLTWDGKAFQTQQRVTRAQWPTPHCNAARPDSGCDTDAKATGRYADPFVDEQAPAARSGS